MWRLSHKTYAFANVFMDRISFCASQINGVAGDWVADQYTSPAAMPNGVSSSRTWVGELARSLVSLSPNRTGAQESGLHAFTMAFMFGRLPFCPMKRSFLSFRPRIRFGIADGEFNCDGRREIIDYHYYHALFACQGRIYCTNVAIRNEIDKVETESPDDDDDI